MTNESAEELARRKQEALERRRRLAKGEEDPTPRPPAADPEPQEDPLERAQRLAFEITGAWEGTASYANYNNYDAGIVSYGKHQVTLASGNLEKVLDDYLTNATGDTASLQVYMDRVRAKDPALRDDEGFRGVLVAAAEDPAMHVAQDRTVINEFWVPATGSASARGLTSALSLAFLFDTAIQHGPYHQFIAMAEEHFGVESRSKVGENGITEQQLTAKTAEFRLQSLQAFAQRTKLMGVIPRGQFWVDVTAGGDWDLVGDENGQLVVNGRTLTLR